MQQILSPVLVQQTNHSVCIVAQFAMILLAPVIIIVWYPGLRLVVDVLKGVEGERRCFRLVGGVLVERTVKEVLPALQYNNEQVGLDGSMEKWIYTVVYII